MGLLDQHPPADTEPEQLARLARLRWKIELDYKQLKGELGLDHYEGRSYLGWDHHPPPDSPPPPPPAQARARPLHHLPANDRPRPATPPSATTTKMTSYQSTTS